MLDKLSQIDPAKKAFSLADEFKKFAFKGTVIDMAVGIVIGAAFGKIIDSLVKNIIMPFISFLLPGNQAYLNWKISVGAKEIFYGLFIGDVLNFLIITGVIFIFIIKFLGWLTRSRQKELTSPPLTTDQLLLTEIRDLLKKEYREGKQ